MWLLVTILLLGVISSSHAGGSVEDNASSHLNCLASIANLMAEDAHTDDEPDHAEHEDSSLAQEVAQLKASLVALEKRLEIMDNVSAIEEPLEVIHNMSAMEQRLVSILMTKMGQIKSDTSAEMANLAENVSARLDPMELHVMANVAMMRERLVDDFTANMSSLEARLRSDFGTELSTMAERMKVETLANITTADRSNHFNRISALKERIERDFLTNISAVRNLMEADFMTNMTISETRLRFDLMSRISTKLEDNEYTCNSSISALREEIESNIQQNISTLKAELEFNQQYINNVSAMRQALESEHRLDKAAINQRLDLLREEVTANMSSSGEAVAAFRPRDCGTVYNTLGYSVNQTSTIFPTYGASMRVVCQDDWTVIQNRVDGSVDFNQNWNSYKQGFGAVGVQSNFWLGLDNIFTLTSRENYTLRVLIKNWEGEERHADYSGFYVENEMNLYRLRYSIFIGGTAGDGLGGGTTYLARDQPFSTFDHDNDASSGNVAQSEEGGWWYGAGDVANLNGKYHHDHTLSEGIEWDAWEGGYSFKETTMMIKSGG